MNEITREVLCGVAKKRIFWRLFLLLYGVSPACAQIQRLADLSLVSLEKREKVRPISGAGGAEKSQSLPSKPLRSLLKGALAPRLHEALMAQGASLSPQGEASFAILWDTLSLNQTLPYRDADDLVIGACALDDNSAHVTVTLVSKMAGRPSVALQGRLDPLVDVPALAHPIDPSRLITKEDLHFIKVPARKTSRSTLLTMDELIGVYIRPHAARLHTPLKRSDVSRPLLVKRGQLVSLVVKSPRLYLETRAKALDSGQDKAQIRLLNMESHRTIQATVTGPGRAEIDRSPSF